jgi:Flp pilus assembly protein TadG
MVEFALGLPILLALLFGVIEFGRMLFIYTATTSASREAARYGAVIGVTSGGVVRYNDCTGIRDAAKRLGSLAGIQDSDIQIDYDDGPSTAVYATCPPGQANQGDRIQVQVTAHYTPIVPLIQLPGFSFQSITARTLVKDVEVRP